MGLLAPRQGTWLVDNLMLMNVTDIMFHEMILEPRIMPLTNVTFGSLDGTAVAGRDDERENIILDYHLDSFAPDPNFLVYPDRITLEGREIFSDYQAPDFVPYGDEFDEDILDMTIYPFNEAYLDKTNQELWDLFGVAFGGELLPDDAELDPRIVNGWLAPTAAFSLHLPLARQP